MTDAPNPESNPEKPAEADRIAKVMARVGVASRREAERMIMEGRVSVNGEKITSPALDVLPTDKIKVDGKLLDEPQETRLWMYYKPLGLVTSESDEKGRQTVFDALPRDLPRVMSVGRLDLNSEGLLLLTNDGELKRRLELPATGWLRRYRVRVNGNPTDLTFDPLRRGVTIEGEDFQPMEVRLDSQQGANAWLTVGIREGRNREIRRAMSHVGLQVNRLIRIGYGPFKLTGMEENEVREVKKRTLRDQLGGLLTGEAEDKPREFRERGASDEAPRERRKFGNREDGPREAGSREAGSREGGFRSRGPRDDDQRGERRGPRPVRSGEGDEGRKPFRRREDGDAPRPFRSRDGEEGGRKPFNKGPRKEFGARDGAGGDGYKPRGEGFKPRGEGFKPRGEGGYRPRGEDGGSRGDSYKPRGEGFKPRGEGFKPRGEGGYRPRGEDGGSRGDGYKPRGEGFKPRGEGYKPRGDDSKPRSEGFKPRGEGFKPGGPRKGGQPGGGKPFAGKGGRPGGKPGGFKPGGGKPRGPRG